MQKGSLHVDGRHMKTPKGNLEIIDQGNHAIVLSIRRDSAYVIDHECHKILLYGGMESADLEDSSRSMLAVAPTPNRLVVDDWKSPC